MNMERHVPLTVRGYSRGVACLLKKGTETLRPPSVPRAEHPVRPEQLHELKRAKIANIYMPKPAASAAIPAHPWRRCGGVGTEGVCRDGQIRARKLPLALLSPAAITGCEGNEKSA